GFNWSTSSVHPLVPGSIAALDGTTRLAVAGTLSLDAGGFVQAGGTFALTHQTAGADRALSVVLTGVSIFAGIGGTVSGGVVTPGSIGISGSGNVDVAVATVGGLEHVAATGNGLAGSISTGTSLLSLSVTGGSFTSDNDGFNWSTSSVHTLIPSSIAALDGTTTLAVAGTLSLDAGGFVQAGGAFALTHQTAGADSALSLSLTGVSVFAGIGGTVSAGVVAPGLIGVSGSGNVDVAVATVGGVEHVAATGNGLSGSISTGTSLLSLAVTAGSFTSDNDGFNWSTSSVHTLVPS